MSKIVWGLACLASCAYPRAMRRAESLVASGEPRAALQCYDRALLVRPGSERARLGREQAQREALSESLGDARRHLDAGRWREALSAVEDALSLVPGHEGAVALRDEVARSGLAQLGAEQVAGRWGAAYTVAGELLERIPDADGLSERLHTLRSHFYAKSDEAAAQGRFQDALDAVATVARHEPERRPEAEARAASIRERWSERLAAGSQDHEAQGRLGPALALRLRAIEVADRDLDRRAAARLGEVLASRGRLSCSLAIEGAPERVQHLEQALRAELAAIPGIDLVRQGLIHARIDAPPPVCTESYTVSPAAHPYVAGQRELPNPAYGALLDELEAARGRAIEAARAEAGARERVRTLGESRRGMRAALIPDEVSLEAALSEGRALLEQIEEAKEQIGRSLERIESLRATGGDGLQAAVIDLRATQQRLDEDRERLIRVQATAKTLEDVVEARRGQLKEASAELEQGSTALQRLAGDREVARAQVAVLEERLLHTPASLWEDVVETLWYERSRHTRTCEGRVVVAVAEAPPRQLVQRRQVHDEAHPAWPEQGLPEDPLLFPASDEVLIAEIDAQLATELAALIRGALRERIERRMDEATAMTEARPGDGLEIWLASALATPTLLDPGARAQLLRHLREAYGLEAPERFLP